MSATPPFSGGRHASDVYSRHHSKTEGYSNIFLHIAFFFLSCAYWGGVNGSLRGTTRALANTASGRMVASTGLGSNVWHFNPHPGGTGEATNELGRSQENSNTNPRGWKVQIGGVSWCQKAFVGD